MLREIRVEECGSLVNLFPTNPVLLLHYLTVFDCLMLRMAVPSRCYSTLTWGLFVKSSKAAATISEVLVYQDCKS